MSAILSARQICHRSLRDIGEFPVTESAPDGEQLREAMHRLDLIMAQIAGNRRLFHLIPDTLSVSITNGTSSYDLQSTLGADYPVDGIQFPVGAWLEDGDGNRFDLPLVTRLEFETVDKTGETGRPTMAHIDRLAEPTLRIYPTPDADDTTEWTVKLDVQTYAPNVAPSGVTGTHPSSSVLTGFRQAWQRWLVLKLSIDLGSGAIVKLPQASLNNWKEEAEMAKDDLLAYENHEHETTPPVCEAWGL